MGGVAVGDGVGVVTEGEGIFMGEDFGVSIRFGTELTGVDKTPDR